MSAKDWIEKYLFAALLVFIAAAVVVLLIAVPMAYLEQERHRDAFMADCQEHRPTHECEVLWKVLADDGAEIHHEGLRP